MTQIIFDGICFFVKATECYYDLLVDLPIFLRSLFPAEMSPVPIRAIAKSSVMSSSSGEILRALFNIVIPLSCCPDIVYAHHRFLSTSALLPKRALDFSKYDIDSLTLSSHRRIKPLR